MSAAETMKEKIFAILATRGACVGLSNLSLNDIAKEAGIKKPSLYNYWNSRDELIHEFFQYWSDEISKISQESLQMPVPKNMEAFSAESILRTFATKNITLFSTEPIRNLFIIIDTEKYINNDAALLSVSIQRTVFKNVSQMLHFLCDIHKLKVTDIESATAILACTFMERIRFHIYSNSETDALIEKDEAELMADRLIEHFVSLYPIDTL